MTDYSQYCPVCGKHLEPCNIDDYETGYHDSLIYVHDDIPHDDDDIEALSNGIQ